MRYFTYAEIIELHVMIIEDFGGLHGIRDEAGLKSLVEAPQMIAFGVEQYVSMSEKAAV
jgi:prophage maintenance system killer protein